MSNLLIKFIKFNNNKRHLLVRYVFGIVKEHPTKDRLSYTDIALK